VIEDARRHGQHFDVQAHDWPRLEKDLLLWWNDAWEAGYQEKEALEAADDSIDDVDPSASLSQETSTDRPMPPISLGEAAEEPMVLSLFPAGTHLYGPLPCDVSLPYEQFSASCQECQNILTADQFQRSTGATRYHDATYATWSNGVQALRSTKHPDADAQSAYRNRAWRLLWHRSPNLGQQRIVRYSLEKVGSGVMTRLIDQQDQKVEITYDVQWSDYGDDDNCFGPLTQEDLRTFLTAQFYTGKDVVVTKCCGALQVGKGHYHKHGDGTFLCHLRVVANSGPHTTAQTGRIDSPFEPSTGTFIYSRALNGHWYHLTHNGRCINFPKPPVWRL
jgi:hypothetical protein